MCTAFGVSRSGYYAWKERKPSKQFRANQFMIKAIKKYIVEVLVFMAAHALPLCSIDKALK